MNKKLYEHQNDDTVDIFLLVKNADERVAKNGKKFIAFTFQDTSGQMDAKYWDASEEDITTYLAGEVVKINGKRELYQGHPQLKIFSMRLAENGEPKAPELYIERAPMKTEEMAELVNEAIFEITNANMNRIVRYILNKHKKAFFQMPAAKKIHHAFSGGLAFHTVSMLKIARFLSEQYNLNKPLLFSGLLLHDLGKVIELTDPATTEYTLEGNMIGHIVLVDEEISQACEALKIDQSLEDIILLKHMVLSHHGHLEYGSPTRPKLREAEVLYFIDNLDASIAMLNDTLDKTQPGTFTERIFGLDNRSFYNPNIKE
ncbi:3'-5' exoribonuclease YhaM family protein [Lacticigenium naphthae]|uniref:3'-5' exoribonuclease YhaM family protein n=1 Tax=Lacticigenium naphthae TaxID=515351 RepID=UPI0004067B53|nr:HD domain-containing protein [Lacticigenium naphthae]